MWGVAPRGLTAAGNAATSGGHAPQGHTAPGFIGPPTERRPSSRSITKDTSKGPTSLTPVCRVFDEGALRPPRESVSCAHGHSRGLFGERGYGPQSKGDSSFKRILQQKRTRHGQMPWYAYPPHTRAEERETDSGCKTSAAPNAKCGPGRGLLTSCCPLGPHPAYWSFALLTSGGSRL